MDHKRLAAYGCLESRPDAASDGENLSLMSTDSAHFFEQSNTVAKDWSNSCFLVTNSSSAIRSTATEQSEDSAGNYSTLSYSHTALHRVPRSAIVM